MKFSIALLQIISEDSQEKNLQKGIEYCEKAKEMGADLVLFPEEWNIGFKMCPFNEEDKKEWEGSAIDQQSNFFQEFVSLAGKLEINIALTYLEKHDPKPRNTVSIINSNGKVVLNYSKVFICNFGQEQLTKVNPDLDEIGCDYNCSPGTSFEVCTLFGKEGEVKVGAMICADREFPEAATELFINGAEIMVVPNASTWNNFRDTLLRARAFENFVGIAMANYPKPNSGNSCAYDCVIYEDGEDRDTLIVKAGEEVEGIFLATFDLEEIRRFRKMESWRVDYRKNWYK